ncbi:dynein regulatory complex subunit 3 [Brienomyrus brachyistius]|uniref:dynein regulatory complex subunit 3 n=1 Tax=Brienomyrus brachyistius TaxID=42636 RepID=UPI0020B1D880|nr:dynein regulatory complex subunit 3 [Brienomyrus brachyistius]XP_048848315.1 dynein regulatory complex subunit 3 [Brienomyrus brachyistius]XP_048848316.1 dynein regulatory complex subunit 3 [Brienomyrus brachyistius]
MREPNDTLEPSVIDEEMLQRAVEEQGPQDAENPAASIAKAEGIQREHVRRLRLDFRKILKIDHLWEFTCLTKLQLDNNVINKIQGLESLVNLVWLDLSFNHIEVIEGLNTLLKLENLSLYNNRISVIENMDSLVHLQVVSLGNNLLSQLDNIVYLRRFESLRTLNLAGNPFCKDENYKALIAAYLQGLVYLDYRLVDEETRKAGLVKYQDALEELRHKEGEATRVLEAKRRDEEELRMHREAFVEFLNGPYLFDSMYAGDPEAAKLACLPGLNALLDSYRSQQVALCMQMFELGLQQWERRKAEVDSFFEGCQEAVADNRKRGAQLVDDFQGSVRETLAEMQHSTEPRLLETQWNQFRGDLSQLCDTLLTVELELVDQLEDIIKEFERNFSEMTGSFLETLQGIFTQCRDLENQHHGKLQEIALATLDRVAKGTMEQEMPDDVLALFVDKDTLLSAVGASHDTHLLRIDNREDELVTRVNKWVTELMKTIQNDEVKRNRKRIAEIFHYADYVKEQMREALDQETR